MFFPWCGKGVIFLEHFYKKCYNGRMKKYKYSFPKSAFVIYLLIIAAAVVAIVFAALRLAGVGNFLSVYPAVDITSVVVFALFLVLLGLHLFASYYGFDGKDFVIKQLFSKKRIERDVIARFVLDEQSGVAALYYIDPQTPDALSYVMINLRSKDMDAFIVDLRAFKSDIVVLINPTDDGEE